MFNNDRPNFLPDTHDCYRKLIERFCDKDPSKRPTFNKIVEELTHNEDFFVDGIDKDEYFDYIYFIHENELDDYS